MRRGLLAILLTAVTAMLVGCSGNLFVEMDTRISNSGGRGTLTVTVSGTGLVNETLKDGDLSEYFIRVEDEGFLVRRYTEGESAFVELSGNFESLEQLNVLQADLLAPLKLAPVIEYESQPGLFVSRNIFDVTFHNLMGDDMQSPETFTGTAVAVESTAPTDIVLTYRLRTPGKILSSNALGIENNAATWTLSSGQMQSNIALGVLSEQVRYGRIAGVALIGALAVVAVYKRFFL